jgi:hypothetical protein
VYTYDLQLNTWDSTILTVGVNECQLADMLLQERYWVIFGGMCSGTMLGGFRIQMIDLLTLTSTDYSSNLVVDGDPIPGRVGFACRFSRVGC